MARELSIRIQVEESEQARAALDSVERGLREVEAAGGRTAAKVGNASSSDNSSTVVGGLKALRNAAIATGLVTAAGQVIAFGGRLTDLSAQTGIGVEALQRLDAVGRTVGVGLEQSARGINVMQRSLVGDTGAQKAVEGLGLSVEALLKMSPDQAFMAIAREVAKIPDPAQRTATAVEVLGRSGQQLLPLLLADIEGIGNGVTVMNEKTVAGLDKWDDAWAGAKQFLMASVGNFLGSFATIEGALEQLIGFLPGVPAAFKVNFDQTLVFWKGLGTGALEIATSIFTNTKTWLVDKWIAISDGVRASWKVITDLTGKAKDTLITYAKDIYLGIKTWMVDRFSDIVSGVRQKFEAVTGFARQMWDDLVGHSIIPDTINGIATQFGRLDAVMVTPTREAVLMVTSLFNDLSQSIGRAFGEMLTGQMTFKDAMLSIWQSIRDSISRIFGGIVDDFISGVLGKILNAATGAAPSIGAVVADTAAKAVGAGAGAAGAGAGAGAGGGAGGGIGLGGALGTALGTGIGLGGLGLLVWGLMNHDVAPWTAAVGAQEADKFFDQFGGEDGLTDFMESLGMATEEIAGLVEPLHDELVLGIRSSFERAVEEITNAIRSKGVDITDGDFQVPGFASGTGGQFLDFGAGKMAVLHGEEAVVRRSDSQGLAEAIAEALVGRVGGGKAVINIDRRKLAEILVPAIPGVVDEYGIAG